MTTNKHKTELQKNYESMVEAVEEFVVKEGKSLQQAFHAAEEKLDDAKKISKEKIKLASTDLKNNLGIFSDALEGVGKAYKDEINFDVDYVSNSIWEKFQSIANSNTVELMAFTKNLRENAQAVLTQEHLLAHTEHHQWSSEHAFWLDEIELWKEQHRQALTKLVDIENAFKQQANILAGHENAIKIHSELEHQHEQKMANEEQDPTSEAFKIADDKKAALHQQEREIHLNQSVLHNEFKVKHLKIMAMINMLYKETLTAI
jgi:hypothetical protein